MRRGREPEVGRDLAGWLRLIWANTVANATPTVSSLENPPLGDRHLVSPAWRRRGCALSRTEQGRFELRQGRRGRVCEEVCEGL